MRFHAAAFDLDSQSKFNLQFEHASDVRFLIPNSELCFGENAMFREILTFGYDACHRWTVLRFAGFKLYECESIRDLRQQLMASTNLAAVIMVEDIVHIPSEAIIAARCYFDGPLVLFEGRHPTETEHSFDLCIPNLTNPTDWLPRIQGMIDSYRATLGAKRSEELM